MTASTIERSTAVTRTEFPIFLLHPWQVWVSGGIDLDTVRELLGHANLKMTLRYAHFAPEHKAQAVTALDRVGDPIVRIAVASR